MAKKIYPVKQASSSVVKESEVMYEKQSKTDLPGKDAAKQYYTVDEFFSILKDEINDRFGYEIIRENCTWKPDSLK
jgi:hypothetical protein